MITIRTIPTWDGSLPSLSPTQVMSNDNWNDLVRNTDYLNESGVLAGSVTGYNGTPIYDEIQAEYFYPVNIQYGHDRALLSLRLDLSRNFGGHVIELFLVRGGGSEQLMAQVYNSNRTQPTLTAIGIPDGIQDLHIPVELKPSTQANYRKVERAYIKIVNTWANINYVTTGIRSLSLKCYRSCP